MLGWVVHRLVDVKMGDSVVSRCRSGWFSDLMDVGIGGSVISGCGNGLFSDWWMWVWMVQGLMDWWMWRWIVQ